MRSGFSLIEVMVVVSLMSLIVLALMAVFTSTQRAFRASVTQSEVLESSRAAMEMITADLRTMTPSGGTSNNVNGPVNFFVVANGSYSPLTQTLPGGSVARTNVLNYFFTLGRNNTTWTATGYIVNAASASPPYPLYRFYEETNVVNSPWLLYYDFLNAPWTNMSHVMDGVVHLTLHAYDTNGVWINNNNSLYPYTNAPNTLFVASNPGYGEPQLYMFSNTVPAAVELELGALEDRVLAHAESLPNNLPAAPPNDSRSLYLQTQSGAVHLFRQRVNIPNVDPTAYQ